MLSDLEKIMVSDRRERVRVAHAAKESQALLDQAQNQVQVIQAKLQSDLTLLREIIQEEILRKAEAQATEEADKAARYITGLKDKQRTQGEELAAFLCAQVLSE
jgi:hypothetical protein